MSHPKLANKTNKFAQYPTLCGLTLNRARWPTESICLGDRCLYGPIDVTTIRFVTCYEKKVHTKLRRVGRMTVGGSGTLPALVIGSGVVGASAAGAGPSSPSASCSHGQRIGLVYSSWQSEHIQWLQRPSGWPAPSESARAHTTHVGMVRIFLKCSGSEWVSQQVPCRCTTT